MDKNNLYGLYIDENKFTNSRIFSGRYFLLKHCSQFIPSNPILSEVGVAEGFFSQTIIDILNPKTFYLIDIFQHNSPHKEYTSNTHYAYIINKFKSNEKIVIKKGYSNEQLNLLEPDSLDYIYIDADHSYNGVKKDIEASYRVIKSGGIIQFNDYTTFSPVENTRYGVLHAVNEFLQTHNIEVLGLSLDKDGYHDVAIRVTK